MVSICWITEQIAVGSAFLDEDIPNLKEKGIDAIVDVRSEYCDNKELIEKSGMQFLHVGVDDRYSPNLEQLEEIFNFVEPLLDKGKRILIHCQNSCGRSPLIAVAILAKRGMGIAEAVNLIEDKHSITGFSEPQEKFIYTELQRFFKNFTNYKPLKPGKARLF